MYVIHKYLERMLKNDQKLGQTQGRKNVNVKSVQNMAPC